MMGFIEPEAAPREEEVIPYWTAEAETGSILLEEGPAVGNTLLACRVARGLIRG